MRGTTTITATMTSMTRSLANATVTRTMTTTMTRSPSGTPFLTRRRTRTYSTHENPLGLPRTSDGPRAPVMPRKSRSGAPEKRHPPNVRQVLVVSSGKGGVGKSSVSVNLALALLNHQPENVTRPLRVGLLDLDIFGPSVPKLLGLEKVGQALHTEAGALLPLTNHNLPTMSMTYLLPEEQSRSPVVWRGMMVQKAVQQLLFHTDWRASGGASSDALDLLVIDTPPGTGDVHLTLTQLVNIDAAIVVSTPQEVALEDTRKGVEMFRKVGLEPTGLILNMSHYIPPPPLPQDPLPLFGSSKAFDSLANELHIPILGRIPIEPAVSAGGDTGWPVVLKSQQEGGESRRVFVDVAKKVWETLLGRKRES